MILASLLALSLAGCATVPAPAPSVPRRMESSRPGSVKPSMSMARA